MWIISIQYHLLTMLLIASDLQFIWSSKNCMLYLFELTIDCKVLNLVHKPWKDQVGSLWLPSKSYYKHVPSSLATVTSKFLFHVLYIRVSSKCNDSRFFTWYSHDIYGLFLHYCIIGSLHWSFWFLHYCELESFAGSFSWDRIFVWVLNIFTGSSLTGALSYGG